MDCARRDLQIIVLAAGQGKRMKSKLPKVLHRLCGQTLIERVIRAASGLNPKRIVLVIGHSKELVLNELNSWRSRPDFKNIEFKTAIQDEQLGTGHAVQMAFPELDENISKLLIVPGDSPLIKTSTLEPLVTAACAASAPDLLILTTKPTNPHGLGRIVRNKDGSIKKIVEELDCDSEEQKITEVNTSIYAGKTVFFKSMLDKLGSDNAQKEIYLTDIVEVGLNNGSKVEGITTQFQHEVAGANSREELSMLEKIRRAEINRAHMLAGVSFQDPDAAYIDEGVKLGLDSYIGAGVSLKGTCEIGCGVSIDEHSTIINSSIGDNVHIKHASHIEAANIGNGCQIGPFARLRPDSVLEADVRIGNFVETKKVHIQRDAKVNHLTYLGDAEVGEEVNVGAGTITCNYDGFAKHKTTIANGAFIGSNASLVAPVNIGAGAIVGAGSVITEDVPANALAIERSTQKNIDEWAKQKRIGASRKTKGSND
ncbi:MAG: bifunctional UDP-N-acetylglucosamine diphosphorylase/glucosamine-1-phosphate N-acetyltransferase GlmU [Deltaproteobacteria bacterium]|nr:bifunctional UDP-N-acetylglucosamine diphosphorylase/glucosamine-1-phosphate N-acetyltransferase GlmU [Deltaproteobacteria bacterium]